MGVSRSLRPHRHVVTAVATSVLVAPVVFAGSTPLGLAGQSSSSHSHSVLMALPPLDQGPVDLARTAKDGQRQKSPAVFHRALSAAGKRRHVHRPLRPVVAPSAHKRVLQVSANTSYDVPAAALHAYRSAAANEASVDPGCHLSWGILAAIGQVESDHGRYGGAVVLANGMTYPRIVGKPLNGRGVARVPDTDNGRLDGDKTWDRAVGPMQFIPSTWYAVGVDGDGNGKANPNDFNDAALTAARYLCAGYPDMAVVGQARRAIMSYNHSRAYVNLVLRIANVYDSGVVDVVPNGHRSDAVPQRRHHAHHHRARAHHRHRARHHRHTTHRTQPPRQQPPRQQPPKPRPPTHQPPPAPTGVVTGSGTSWFLDGKRLNLGSGAGLHVYQSDYDGDGVVELVTAELAGLRGKSGTVVKKDAHGVVTAIDRLAYTASPTGVITGTKNSWKLDGSALVFSASDLSTLSFTPSGGGDAVPVVTLLSALRHHIGTTVQLSGGTIVASITVSGSVSYNGDTYSGTYTSPNPPPASQISPTPVTPTSSHTTPEPTRGPATN